MVLPRARVQHLRGVRRIQRRRDDRNAGVLRRLDRSIVRAAKGSGRGVGTELLQVAQRCFDHLQLWTFQRNVRARHFYEVRGFALVQETDGARNEENEPDARYLWTR